MLEGDGSEMEVNAANDEIDQQIEVLRSGSVDLLGEADLRERLRHILPTGGKLRVKLGMDPSAPDLHLGHAVVLQKLKTIQDLGHTPIFLIGDFTARIGDPSGKKKTRPALSEGEVETNSQTYLAQVGRILDVDRAEIRRNSEWMNRMTAADVVRLCSCSTVARLLERDDFAKRLKEGVAISVHEILYPFVQGYDSVALEADLEIGGTDQTFNLLMGRDLQRAYGQLGQAVLTQPLLVGLDGNEKMSKSLNNTIGICDPPDEMFGKAMRISDSLMLDWFDALSDGAWEDLRSQRILLSCGEGDPLAFKQELAQRIVARFHSPHEAQRAREHFVRVVRERELPAEIPHAQLGLEGLATIGLLDAIRRAGMTASTSEARRLVLQGGVRVDGAEVADPALQLKPGTYLIRVGKRRICQLAVTP